METNHPMTQKFEAVIKEYYHKFDQRQPLEAFEHDFDWSDLLISSPDSRVSTKDEYAAFYSGVAETFVDSTHEISNFVLTHQSKELVNAASDVVFTAKQKPALTPVEVTGRSFLMGHLKGVPKEKKDFETSTFG